MYSKYLKRVIDFLLSLIATVILSPLILVLAIIGSIIYKGNPFFTQFRPGKDGKIFKIVKFRSMTNKRNKNGELLSDDERLNSYGKFLRLSSLDELPSLVNILAGEMAIVGPRPQLVKDMVFMTEEQKKRHTVRPGLTGLAQCSGRNNMTWERKFEYDLEYIEKITFWNDFKIVVKTFFKVIERDGVNEEGMTTSLDFGDWLLKEGKLEKADYEKGQTVAKELMKKK